MISSLVLYDTLLPYLSVRLTVAKCSHSEKDISSQGIQVVVVLLLLCDLHMTWQGEDSWHSILGSVHMTAVQQKKASYSRDRRARKGLTDWAFVVHRSRDRAQS
ncbi:unnamed protein product [Boreogadus saida]